MTEVREVQPSKVEVRVTSEEKVKHPGVKRKEPPPSEAMEMLLISTDTSAVQFAKAPEPTIPTFLPKETEVSELQPSKAFKPIVPA